jgi:hypothetical protein
MSGHPGLKGKMKYAAFTITITLMLMSLAQAAAPRGPVHNERAAILMARKIWISLYPDSAAKAGSEKAWLAEEKATRDGDMWEVGPKHPSPAALGSGLVFRLSSEDGQMMGYYNPQ